MRLRFFLIILVVVTLVSIALVWLHSRYLWQAKLDLIDQQVRETALTLVDSRLGDLQKGDLDKADAIISEELGENRIGKFFIIRNGAGQVLYESSSSQLLPFVEIPQDPQWLTIQDKNKFIRVLNLKLPSIENRTLQVGLLISNDLVAPGYFSESTLTFIAVAFILAIIVTFFLTSTLLRPIRNLAQFVTHNEANPQGLMPLPESFKSLGGHDEYSQLVHGLELLIERVNRNYRLTRLWAYQLAHELKTPMTVLNIEMQKIIDENKLTSHEQETFELSLKRMEQTVSAFLGWAELEGQDSQRALYANKAQQVLQEVIRELEQTQRDRIQLQSETEFYIFCDPEHLRQCFRNLLSNALRYSDEAVHVNLTHDKFSVLDLGPGIPAQTLERLGQPFNRGTSKVKGHGLGLAWVMTVARIYDWKFMLESKTSGTVASLHFPSSHHLSDMEDLSST